MTVLACMQVEKAFNERLDQYRDAKDDAEHHLAEVRLKRVAIPGQH